jgi:hypothetical protein
VTEAPSVNVEAEESVLGAMLVAVPALEVVLEVVGLSSADFYFEKNRNLFQAIAERYAEEKAVDELTVVDALERKGCLEAAGGKHYAAALAAKVPAAGNAKHYAEIVRERAEERREREVLRARLNGDLSREGLLERLSSVEPRTGTETSWVPVDLASAIEGDEQPEPSILGRSDGPCLLYAGKIHEVAAEPESGKGWLALSASVRILDEGGVVVYIDFESSAPEIVERLLALGVDETSVLERFLYLAPADPLTPTSRRALEATFERDPALVVVDGVTEAMTLHGLDLNDSVEIARWLDLLARPAARAGAAVLLVDHVVKDKEARGRYSIGGQHKLAGIDVAYSLEVVEPFARERTGLVTVKVRKDRPGFVRTYADGDLIARMRLTSDPETGDVEVVLDPPPEAERVKEERREALRGLVEAAATEALEDESPLGRNRLVVEVRKRGAKGKSDRIRSLLSAIAADPASRVRHDEQEGFSLAQATLTPPDGVNPGSPPSGPDDPEGGSAPKGPPSEVGRDPDPGGPVSICRYPAHRGSDWKAADGSMRCGTCHPPVERADPETQTPLARGAR